jgi:hypothetical protein
LRFRFLHKPETKVVAAAAVNLPPPAQLQATPVLVTEVIEPQLRLRSLGQIQGLQSQKQHQLKMDARPASFIQAGNSIALWHLTDLDAQAENVRG